jgi:hypothetical protein
MIGHLHVGSAMRGADAGNRSRPASRIVDRRPEAPFREGRGEHGAPAAAEHAIYFGR